MGSINKQITRYEFTPVYTHPDAKVDIILVHGLNGDPQRTWTAHNGVFWPTDLLPDSLQTEHANVLVYGYNADVYSSRNDRSASNNFIHHHAQTLVTNLAHYRKSEGTSKNPILWVAHSLGGILTKRALLYSNDVRNQNHDDLRSVYVSTYGIVFLGTPHTGSGLATWGTILQHMSDVVVPKKLFETEPHLLKTLKKDNETLQNINNHFLDVYQRFQIHMAHENHKTDVKGSKVMVVDSSSASPQLPGVTYYGIESTHSGMCKFESAIAPGYRMVSTAIRDWVKEAPDFIRVRWTVELEDRHVRQRLDLYEHRLRQLAGQPPNPETAIIAPEKDGMPLPQTPTTPDLPVAQPLALDPETTQTEIIDMTASQTGEQPQPLFIHPEPFRPNSYFVGRQGELAALHKMLMDPGRRSQGTSAVLIQCLPGGGKTHLARQYVFQHKDDYPGGVYWVRAKSQQELEYNYWRIAKSEALRGLLGQEEIRELQEPKKVVAMVRKWLNGRDNWLLVVDGIHFDTPGLRESIPDAQNTSLIFTSTERAATGDHHFDNPQLMELPLLSTEDARDLLLQEMDKRPPWTQDDRARAGELVELMGRLPLMIHVAARHLKATRDPLSRYLRQYKSRPHAGVLSAYKAVRDQLQKRGATAALNLMSILVFFDQQIPVEMVTLGLSAIDNRTPLKTGKASRHGANLTDTLGTLIAFALIERTEIMDMSPTSSRSSRRSFDRPHEGLDILRVHSVVQAFFIDTLGEEKQAPFWLERAAAVWCRSFDEADKKIREHADVGLPEDYRRFALHGRKLVENARRLEKKAPALLGQVAQDVEQRLARSQAEIDRLSQAIQTHIVEGSSTMPSYSVFDRTASSSETDSMTPPSHSSTSTSTSTGAETGAMTTGFVPILNGEHGYGQEQFQSSPATYGPDLGHDPYHWHIPYPQQPTIPVPSEPSDVNDDATTIAGSPKAQVPVGNSQGRPSPRPPSSSSKARNGGFGPDRQDPNSDWDFIVPNHRAVRKIESRRYKDHAGAWRDTSISDPRVSISRETAKGSISRVADVARAPSQRTLTAGSEAELQLHKIRQGILPPAGGEDKGLIQDIGRRLGSQGTVSRPRLTLGRNSYTEAVATKAPEKEVYTSRTDFSNSLARIVAPPSSWTAATLKKLMEDKPPADTGSPSHMHRPSTSSPGPLFAGSGTRSANSSPGPRSSPFAPPQIPVEINDTDESTAQHGFPPAIRQWDTHTYHPTLSRVESSGLAYSEEDLMSLSYPSARPGAGAPYPDYAGLAPPNHRQTTTRAQPAVGPGGYTSQPMSRNPSGGGGSNQSHKSAPATAATHSSPLAGGSGGSFPSSPHSRPVSGSESGATTRPFLLPFLIPGSRRRRRPSHTETEPSPRSGDAFPDVETSYRRWEDRHGIGQDRRVDTETDQPPQGHTGTSTSGRWRRSPLRAARRLGGRSQSQSPAPRGRRMLHKGRRGGGGGDGRRELGGEGGEEATAAGRNPSSGSSPSGGFMLPDGRLVGFGERSDGAAENQLGIMVPPPLPRTRSEEGAERRSDGGAGLGILES